MSEALPAPRFDHLLKMTDHRATFEHACLSEPRCLLGYCVDDMARVLVVTTREPEPAGEVNRLAGVAIRFLNDAQTLDGACRNRMDSTGRWVDEPSLEDCWGRCIWGLGTAIAYTGVGWVRKMALVQFERAARARSPWARASAFAALGAAEVLSVLPDHRGARKLITDYAMTVRDSPADTGWPWPEARLTYANAVLPDAMIAAGVALEAPKMWQRGLELLAWLLDAETRDGHLSPAPVGGRGPLDSGPGFDQQPIEVAALADACARAAAADPSPQWPNGVRLAADWFGGANDAGQVMWDPETGAGYDGLHADGVNRNQGAESTLAVISTLQHARRIALLQQ